MSYEIIIDRHATSNYGSDTMHLEFKKPYTVRDFFNDWQMVTELHGRINMCGKKSANMTATRTSNGIATKTICH